MSRTIKFRVWDGENMVSPDYIDREGYGHWKANSIPNASNNLMQFTGLTDKAGVEIYEGDILEQTGGLRGKVEFYAGGFYFEDKRTNMTAFSAFGHGTGIEVIGNIMENGDLLR